jgi:histidine ammonia-lyase
MITLGNRLDFEDLKKLAHKGTQIQLDESARKRIRDCKSYLDRKIATSSEPIYGINTGFGSLYHTSIEKYDLSQLQENLLKSHACGLGDQAEQTVVRLMLALKIQSLSFGFSGVDEAVVDRLIHFYNYDILPVVYRFGSLGASGDLAPLAHLSLPLIGLGEVSINGTIQDAASLALPPLKLGPKEGLALINGTQYMTAVLTLALIKATQLASWADVIGAMSLEAFDGRPEPFHPSLHSIRPHTGQIHVAENMRTLLHGSPLIDRPKVHVQDPYSFRCIPQVHGASRDVITRVQEILLIEVNAVTDNPTVFPEEDLILSGGNFHGQTLAMHADFLTIAISELGNISERRIFQLIAGLRGLPAFLVRKPGLNSGFMIPQYAAASIVNRNKVLCTPASSDSIVSSNGQEDHVSMGATSVNKCLEVADNCLQILAIELMNASQALSFRGENPSSDLLNHWVNLFRKSVPIVEDDVWMHPPLKQALTFLETHSAPIS